MNWRHKMQLTDSRLLELINKSPEEMTDEELDNYIKTIRHTGIKRQERKAERLMANKSQKAKRETAAVRKLRQALEAKGLPTHKIEDAITAMKKSML